jgi:UDP-glucose 4-epimerase
MSAFQGRSVMVTGGAGFIGSHLVRRLQQAEAARVVVLDAFRRPAPPDLKAETVRFTLGQDRPEALADVLRGVDFLFHFAAEKHRTARENPQRALQGNVIGTHDLLQAAARAGVKKVVYASSVYVYGRDRGPAMVETEVPRPDTVYGLSKLAGEHLLARFAREGGPAWVALRYFFVYGPGQEHGGYPSLIVRSLERLRAGQAPTIYGDGEQALDYVYVDDAVEAALVSMTSSVSGEVFNVGSGTAVSVSRVVDELIRVSGRAVGKTHLDPDETAGSSRVASIDKIRQALGWTPRVALRDGLERTGQAAALA